MSEGQLLALTEHIYDAAAGTTSWSMVGQGLMRLVGAHSASLMAGDFTVGKAELLYHGDFPMDVVIAYRNYYRKVDLWTNRAAEAVAKHGMNGRLKVWTSGHLVPDSEFLRSEFYTEFGRHLGLRYVVGTVVPLGAAGVMPIGLHRPDGAAPFTEMDTHLLECLLPHLRRALQLRHQLNPAAALGSPGLDALDALAMGILVVDAEAHVILANAAAEIMMASGSAIRCLCTGRRAEGRTTAIALHREDNSALRALVRVTAAGGSSGGAVRLRNGEGNAAIAALVAPLPRRLLNTSGEIAGRVAGQALILLRDLTTHQEPPTAELLRDLFGLTPAEAEVARTLAGGATKGMVAAKRHCKESTVRTQVRSVLEKTGTTNLRDLERLLSRLQPS
jgi:DNA-binding NarL/FixJ family response regulator